MTDGGQKMAAVHHEHTRELPPIRPRRADSIALENRGAKPGPPDARMRELSERRLLETKFAIDHFLRIADTDDVGNLVVLEPMIRFLWWRHVDERQLRSGGFDGDPVTRQGRQRFPAEGSTEVAEED